MATINGTDTDNNLTGTAVADSILGNGGNDILNGLEGVDTLDGGTGNDTLDGGAGNDNFRGGEGNDTLLGRSVSGNEVDNISGGLGEDSFILGIGTTVFYDDGNSTNAGTNNFGYITDFNTGLDFIQLAGFRRDYRLAASPNSLFPGTGIYYTPTSEPDELIGIVRGSTVLSLDASYFRFTQNLPVAGDDTIPGTVLLSSRLNIPVAQLLANDSDADNDQLTITGVSNPANGIVSLSQGMITFRANPNYAGSAAFDYTVSDGKGGTDTGRVNLSVTSVVPLGSIVSGSGLPVGAGGFALNGFDVGDEAGFSVSSAGDVNGDGLADLIVGAPDASPGQESFSGQSYVVFGKTDGTSVNLSAVAGGSGGFAINGIGSIDSSGYSVSSAGDVNGDGLADLIVGAPNADLEESSSGQSYVVFGKTDGTAVNLSAVVAGSGGFAINGINSGDESGYSVSSAGDVNGDGLADLIVGAHDADLEGNDRGQSYVVFGKTDGTAVNLSAVVAGSGGFAINGINTGDESGFSVSGAGDVNGDGLADLIVGAYRADPGGDNSGQSYVVFGKTDGNLVNLSSVVAGSGGFVLNGIDRSDESGFSVSSAGDVNGDGLADLIVGAPEADVGGVTRGQSYVVFGKTDGTSVNLSAVAGGSGGFALNGFDRSDEPGYSVSSAGDVNGDGLADLIVGAPDAEAGGSYRGQSYVVFGKTDGTTVNLSAVAGGSGGFVLNGINDFDSSGSSVSSAGDVNGDGFADLIVGAYRADVGGINLSGQSYVVNGCDFSRRVAQLGTNAGDTLTGTINSDVLVGGQGNDVLKDGNFRDVILYGGAGSDRIEISNVNFRRLDGGLGVDTLAFAGSGLTLDLTDRLDNTQIAAIERINLTGTGNNTLTLSYGALLNLVEETTAISGFNTLSVLGNTGDVVNANLPGFIKNDVAGEFTNYTKGNLTLLVNDSVTQNITIV